MKILVVCGAGMSSSLLEASLVKYMKSIGVEGKAEAMPIDSIQGKTKDWDCVLIGPQIRYRLNDVKRIAGEVPVEVIPPADYAMAKGDKVYELAKRVTGK